MWCLKKRDISNNHFLVFKCIVFVPKLFVLNLMDNSAFLVC